MATQTESPQLVESCVRIFQTLSADPSFGQLGTLVGENERLRTENSRLQTAYEVNLHKLTGLHGEVAVERGRTAARTNELEASKTAAAELEKKVAETEAALKDKVSELVVKAEEASRLQKELAKREAENDQLKKYLEDTKSEVAKAKKSEHEAQEQLKALTAELKQREARLSKLDSFVVKLEPEPSDATRDQLGAIFKESFSLARSYFGADFANDVLSDSSRWKEIRGHPVVVRAIPVPSTNSPAAKRMRVAASLAILAAALREHVFQPTYLLGDNELARLMNDLSDEDFEREAHLRSVLLRLCPSMHDVHALERAQKARNDLLSCVGPLLPESRRDGFASALDRICRDAGRCWEGVQRLADRVDPEMSFEAFPEKDAWKLMTFPGMEGPQQQPPSKTQGSASSGGKKNGVKAKAEAEAAAASSKPSNPEAVEDVVAGVWPAFVLTDENEGQETLHEGLVLRGSQVEEAKAEESSGFRTGARRAMRTSSRRHSVQIGGDAAAKKPFLSAGAGGPSGAD
ncbi:hypothetical protein LX36DRAFT_324158 [Colletotrichum falcatum]|nr:hypothetical protein LX36DRAFT_324158 [Colletotrichum falcatum]